MDPIKVFQEERRQRVTDQGNNSLLKKAAHDFTVESINAGYSYNFSWMGRPIIQYPQDMLAMQEIIWDLRPDIIIETGVAHGGSLIFYASLLELIGNGEIIGIDIDIRDHNRKEIEMHPMSKRIRLIQGSSTENETLVKVEALIKGKSKVMVCLDSNHTHDHVLDELRLYSSFVTLNSYLIVFDTIVEHLPESSVVNRPWGVGNNPKTAVNIFLDENKNYLIDRSINDKLLISVAPDGYLRRTE